MKYMRDCAEHQPEIDPRHRENRYSRWPCDNGQINQNRTQKKENWPWKNGGPKMALNSYKGHIFAQNKA